MCVAARGFLHRHPQGRDRGHGGSGIGDAGSGQLGHERGVAVSGGRRGGEHARFGQRLKDLERYALGWIRVGTQRRRVELAEDLPQRDGRRLSARGHGGMRGRTGLKSSSSHAGVCAIAGALLPAELGPGPPPAGEMAGNRARRGNRRRRTARRSRQPSPGRRSRPGGWPRRAAARSDGPHDRRRPGWNQSSARRAAPLRP